MYWEKKKLTVVVLTLLPALLLNNIKFQWHSLILLFFFLRSLVHQGQSILLSHMGKYSQNQIATGRQLPLYQKLTTVFTKTQSLSTDSCQVTPQHFLRTMLLRPTLWVRMINFRKSCLLHRRSCTVLRHLTQKTLPSPPHLTPPCSMVTSRQSLLHST